MIPKIPTCVTPNEWATVVRTYRGKPGCGCGCLGRYARPVHAVDEVDRHEASDRKTANDLRDLGVAIRAGAAVEVTAGFGQVEGIVSVETDARYLWAYFTSPAAALTFVAARTPDPVPAGATPLA